MGGRQWVRALLNALPIQRHRNCSPVCIELRGDQVRDEAGFMKNPIVASFFSLLLPVSSTVLSFRVVR